MVEVRYEDNTRESDCVIKCKDEAQAERLIEAELATVKIHYFKNEHYEYAEFRDKDGFVYTEIWSKDSDKFVKWTRLFECDSADFGI